MATILLLVIIYAAFISLGIPDGVLGVAWPEIRNTFGVPLETAGYFSIIAATGSIATSFLSGHFTKKYGTGVIVCASAALTGFALLGFALSPNYYVMALCFIPFGIGAGGVDSALNDYVSRHFSSSHMNWLHACWGVGAFSGPLLMTTAIVKAGSWRVGYFSVAIIQLTLFVVFLASMNLWRVHQKSHEFESIKNENIQRENIKKESTQKETIDNIAGSIQTDNEEKSFIKETQDSKQTQNIKRSVMFEKLKQGLHLVKVKQGLLAAMLFFLFYTGAEAGIGLWGASYFREGRGVDKVSAGIWISAFFACITIGRIVSGMLVSKLTTKRVIRLGQCISAIGFICMILPFGTHILCPIGISFIGLGFAPMYPCMMHDSPKHFGLDFSQYAIGYQMGMANIGATFLPLLIGALASATTLSVIPFLTGAFFVGTIVVFRFIEVLPDLTK